MAGVYLHIPFCRQSCSYCDFHFSTNLQKKTELVKAVCAEIEQRHNYAGASRLESIYFGGGTPSLLTVRELQDIFDSLDRFFNWDETTEITLEANPDDIDAEALRAWKETGINRLSIGLQSFNNEELKWMNRAHTAAQSLDSVKLAQDAGFNNITIDLIYGSRFQDLASWEQTLNQAIALGTQHISSYNLTIENRTVLGLQHKKGNEPSVSEELSSEQFLLMKEMLEGSGFVHYEISNFGKPGYFAKHNSNYWLQKPYLGFGPSAHSFDGRSRQWNVKSNERYMQLVKGNGAYFEKEELSLNDRYNEYVLTRLRTIWGCDTLQMTALFGEQITTRFKEMIHEKKDLVKEENEIYTLNRKGQLQADGIASDLFIL